jgi:hypothetical protein
VRALVRVHEGGIDSRCAKRISGRCVKRVAVHTLRLAAVFELLAHGHRVVGGNCFGGTTFDPICSTPKSGGARLYVKKGGRTHPGRGISP